MILSVRKHAIEIHESLGVTKVALTTVQKGFRKYIEPGKQYKDLCEDERSAVYSKVKQSMLYMHRRYKRPQQSAIATIHAKLSENHKVTLGGVKTRFVRMLKGKGGDWDEMSDSEREAFEAMVLEAMTESQSSGVGIEKECYLDGNKVGSARDLHNKLRVILPQPLLSLQIFTKQLTDKFSCQSNVTRIELTIDDATDHLTKAGHNKNNPIKINELATPSRLRLILDGLYRDNFTVHFDAVKTCYDRIMFAKIKNWKELDNLEQDEVMEAVDAKMRDEGNEKYHKKEWALEVDGEEILYSGAGLHRLAQELSKENCLSRQPFLNRLKVQQASDDNSIVDGNKIVDWLAFIESASEWQKKLPATIYKVVFLAGKYAEYKYVGATQCLLEERLKWHCIDAMRDKHFDSQRSMHLAIKDALNYANLEQVLYIEALEKNVSIDKVKERETMYIKQIWGNNCLNSHSKGGSIGGRGSTQQVLYSKKYYGLAEAYRVAANDHVKGDSVTKFIARISSFYYGSAISFDEAVEFALAGQRGRKQRKDLLDFNVANKKMTFEDIQKSDKYPDMNNVQKIRSKVLRHHCSLTQLSESGIDIEPILLGEIKPGSSTPDIRIYLESSPANIKELVKEASSWNELGKLINKPPNTLRDKARKLKPRQFWQSL